MMAQDDAYSCEGSGMRDFDQSDAVRGDAASLLALMMAGSSVRPNSRRGSGRSIRPARGARRPVLLFEEAHIVGVSSIPHIDDVLSDLRAGERLSFVRDTREGAGKWSVEVHAGPHLLGYAPFECSETIARLLDGGRSVSGALAFAGEPTAPSALRMHVVLED